jgi:hypothetical protein
VEPLTAIGFVAFFLVALVVGVRLLLLWRQTGEQPELLIGIGVLGIGPVGFALTVAAQLLAGQSSPSSALCYGLGQLAVAIGAFSKFVFNWRVYHPESRIARNAAVAGGAVLATVWLEAAFRGFPVEAPGFRHLPLVVALLWGSFEALRYRERMRRRARVGLGDPVVENRFLVWGLGAGAAGVGSVISMVAGMIGGAQTLLDPGLLTLLSLHGMAAAVCMWLAFVPPKAYLRFVSRSGSVPAAAV